MKVIYIAGPFRGKTAWEVEKNIRIAEEVGFRVAQMGAVPLIPHTLYRFFNGELTDKFWLDGTMELLTRCDAAFFLEGWQRSSGASAEHAVASRLMPIFDTLRGLEAWLASPEEGK